MNEKPFFPYLKRGQGIEKRYGRINYPKFPSSSRRQIHDHEILVHSEKNNVQSSHHDTNALRRHMLTLKYDNNVTCKGNDDASFSGYNVYPIATITEGRSASADSGHGTTTERTDASDLNREIVQRIRQNRALVSPESNYSDHSLQETQLNSGILSFELYERLAETSLSSDSSLIHRVAKYGIADLIGNQDYATEEKFERHLLSTLQEVIDENTQCDDKTANEKAPDDLFNIAQQNNEQAIDKKALAIYSTGCKESLSNGSPKSEPTKSSQDVNADDSGNGVSNFVLQLPPTMRSYLANSNTFPFLLPQLEQKEAVLQNVENLPTNLSVNNLNLKWSSSNITNDQENKRKNVRKITMLEKRMRAMLDLLSKDADRLTEMRRKLEERENQVGKVAEDLRQDKLAFESRMDNEMVSLRKEYKDLERERTSFAKEQNLARSKDAEMINILKAEIAELNERLNEKDRSLSNGRCAKRELERKLAESQECVKTLQVRYRNLEEQLAKVDKENASLRCQNWKIANAPVPVPLGDERRSLNDPASVARSINGLSRPDFQNNAAVSATAAKSIADQSEQGPNLNNETQKKTVRFSDQSPVFRRTENRSIQTQLDVDLADVAPCWGTDAVLHEWAFAAQRLVRERIDKAFDRVVIHNNYTVEENRLNGSVIYTYNNRDTRKVDPNFTDTYHFAALNITQTTYPDGSKKCFFGSDKREEKRFADGRVEISTADGIKRISTVNGPESVEYPDGTKRIFSPDGSETVTYPNNTTMQRLPNGDEVLSLPDGSREFRTAEYIKRELPNGDVKICYKNGTEERRWASSGRIRIKDGQGNIIKDEISSNPIR